MADIVSVIISVLNGERWIDKCFQSIIRQSAVEQPKMLPAGGPIDRFRNSIKLEVCVFDDASTDDTLCMLQKWTQKLESRNIGMKILQNPTGRPKGVGYGRNVAIAKSTGSYLCFQDIDDEMLPNRVVKQMLVAKHDKNAVGTMLNYLYPWELFSLIGYLSLNTYLLPLPAYGKNLIPYLNQHISRMFK